MTRVAQMFALSLLLSLAFAAVAAEGPGHSQSKTGTIKSVDAQAKSFVLEREPRPLTFTVDEKTTYTLNGKESTFEEAIKPDRKAEVKYERINENLRKASKVEVHFEAK